MAEPFIHRLRVRYAECDQQGVLFNANYLAYIDHTITELWRAAYGGYNEMLARGVDIVVAEANLRFRGSARFDEEVTVAATITNIGTTSVTSTYASPRLSSGYCSTRRCATCSSIAATAAKTPAARVGAVRAAAVAGPGERRASAPTDAAELVRVLGLGRLAGPDPDQMVKEARELAVDRSRDAGHHSGLQRLPGHDLAGRADAGLGDGGGASSILAHSDRNTDLPTRLEIRLATIAKGLQTGAASAARAYAVTSFGHLYMVDDRRKWVNVEPSLPIFSGSDARGESQPN